MSKPGRQPQIGLDSRICPVCGSSYRPYRESSRACSKACYRKLPDVAEKVALHHTQQPVKDRKNAARRERWALEPDRRERSRRALLQRLYGITLDEYQTRLAAQEGKCALCGEKPDPNGKKAASRLHVDHDHETGVNRDLLCCRCNQGIGYFRDDPALFRAAAAYIERHRAPA